MTETIAVSIGASLFVAIIYGFFISNKEDAIRSYLKGRAKGFVRYIYVKAFVSAARGQDKVADTASLTYILIWGFFITASSVHLHLNEMIEKRESVVRQFNEFVQDKPQKTAEELKEELSYLQASVEGIKKTIVIDKRISNSIYWAAMVIFNLSLMIWRPYILMRKRFAHELERFLARIQGLASKQELSNLAILESQITDEASLKEFIGVTKGIAIRHNIKELVSTFDLWKSGEKLS